eukprot:scaffold408_cov347-Pavlova_lutheri.AAC.48
MLENIYPPMFVRGPLKWVKDTAKIRLDLESESCWNAWLTEGFSSPRPLLRCFLLQHSSTAGCAKGPRLRAKTATLLQPGKHATDAQQRQKYFDTARGHGTMAETHAAVDGTRSNPMIQWAAVHTRSCRATKR